MSDSERAAREWDGALDRLAAEVTATAPLVWATGAGAEMRRSLGTAVFSGMLGVTLFGVFLTPVFYSVIQWLGGWRRAPAPRPGATDDCTGPSPPGSRVGLGRRRWAELAAIADQELAAPDRAVGTVARAVEGHPR
jgi:hypothetical protein